MITAVDTNILIDILTSDPVYGPPSAQALKRCLREGQLLISDVVWAETASNFPIAEAADVAMTQLDAEFSSLGQEAAGIAGQAWRRYRKAGGPRTRVAADFLIGAHALVQADRLITRDRGFYRNYFSKLDIIDPGTNLS